jgi:hypothetical protein
MGRPSKRAIRKCLHAVYTGLLGMEAVHSN